MLLAFATFVGLGGDDIPKTIFSICFGLVLASVGFDQISGAPRLVLFDMNGFLQGIGFLVLAIGVYGIGEMLWTIEQTRGEVTTTTPKMTAGHGADTKRPSRAAGRAHGSDRSSASSSAFCLPRGRRPAR
jgi:putative tricarboxylic transport membrane protein